MCIRDSLCFLQQGLKLRTCSVSTGYNHLNSCGSSGGHNDHAFHGNGRY